MNHLFGFIDKNALRYMQIFTNNSVKWYRYLFLDVTFMHSILVYTYERIEVNSNYYILSLICFLLDLPVRGESYSNKIKSNGFELCSDY